MSNATNPTSLPNFTMLAQFQSLNMDDRMNPFSALFIGPAVAYDWICESNRSAERVLRFKEKRRAQAQFAMPSASLHSLTLSFYE